MTWVGIGIGLKPPLSGEELWTPANPTSDGDISPHTWHIPGLGNFQDSAKTTPVTAATDPVGASVNQGSDTYDIVQATAANRPTLQQVTNNGKTFYTWLVDGINDRLQGAFGGGAISQPYTVFVVARLDATAVNDNANHYMLDGDDGSNRLIVGQQSSGIPDNWLVNAGANLTGGDSNGNWNIWTILLNGASSQYWINGTSKASGNAGAQTPNGITVGCLFDGSNFFKGYIAPILSYPGNLSTADKNQVGQYLSRITGITYTDI